MRIPNTFAAVVVSAGLAGTAAAFDTEFTYQGYLEEAGDPYDGAVIAEPVTFRMHTDPVADTPVGGDVVKAGGTIPIADGLFAVDLGFDAGAFDGAPLWLEVIVDGVALSPRQKVTAAPFSLATRGLRVSADDRVEIAGVGDFDANLTIFSAGSAVPSLYLPGNTKDIAWPSGQVLQMGHWDAAGASFSERLRINSEGRVGVNGDPSSYGRLVVRQSTDSQNEGLAVRGSGDRSLRLWIDPDDDRSHIDSGAAGTEPLALNRGGGGVVIGGGAPNALLDVDGHNLELQAGLLSAARFTYTTGAITPETDKPTVSINRSGGSVGAVALDVFGGGGGSGAASFLTDDSAAPAVSIENRGPWTALALRSLSGNAPIMDVFLTQAPSTNTNFAIFRTPTGREARISGNGRGYFNGGTQTGGADVAEWFAVEGVPADYEPGDVLVISTASDRTVTRSAEPYSTLVAGVHATRPGVLLTERHVDADHSDMAPMGVVGVIPTKVCAENGEIRRGDLLVSSSLPGHAMLGTDRDRMLGAIIGKALEGFDGPGTGVIRVMVTPR